MLRRDVLEFQESHAELSQLTAELAADRQALQAFGERMTAVSTRAPELEAKVDAILGKMSLVETASQEATWLKESMSALDGQVSRVEARASLVEKIEARLNGLNTLSTEIDRRLEQQLERRNDFDILKTTSDGVAAQIVERAPQTRSAERAAGAGSCPSSSRCALSTIDIDSTRSSARGDEARRRGGRRAGETIRRARGDQPHPGNRAGRAHAQHAGACGRAGALR